MAIITGNVCTDIVAVIVSIIAVIIVYFKWSYSYWSRRDVPTLPPRIPFGNATTIFSQSKTFGTNMRDVYFEMKSKGLKYCGYYFLTRPALMIFDVELIRSIMAKDFNHFTDRGSYSNEEIDPLTSNLFATKGLKWKHMRIKLTPTFSSGKMKMMFNILLNCTNELVTVMDEIASRKEGTEMKEIVGRFTTDVIGSCAFGINCNSLKNPNSEFREYGKKVFDVGILRSAIYILSFSFPKVLEFFRLRVIESSITNFFVNVVNETVTYREKNNTSSRDFLQLLIQLKNGGKIKDDDSEIEKIEKNVDAGDTLTIEEITAQCFLFFLAVFETSSTTSTFCLYELVQNPDIQEKLREEVNRIIEKHEGKITYNAIMEMTYMDKCINETLRKYPPVPVLMRECTQTYKIPDSDLVLDKGVQIFVPVLGIQNDPENYPDPDKFDPERFSQENISQRHPYCWIPFGEGPRNCIGLRFGMMQIKVALAVLLRNYKFSLNPKTQVPLVMEANSFVLSVLGGVWLDVEKIIH